MLLCVFIYVCNHLNSIYFVSTFIQLFTGFEEIVQMLIEKDANLNAVDEEDNNSALIFAVERGNISIYFN